MRRHSIVVAVLFAAQAAVAKCPYSPCYAITFDTLECVAENDINDSFPGARLKIKPLKVREVACGPDYSLLLKNNDIPEQVAKTSEYFYHLYSRDSCGAFRGRTVTMFLERECCDTVPATGACAKRVQSLKDLPPWAQ